MNSRQQELHKAIEFVRNTFADRRIHLDYSTESVKHLDKLLDDEFKKGKLKNPEGNFAKFQGLIMIGISGYLAQVILKNATQAKLDINEDDQNWFINFKITGPFNQVIQPGQRVLKRVQYGSEAELYQYVHSAIKYFSDPASKIPDDSEIGIRSVVEKKKPWWKFWQR
ncbi:MAG: hypothetical protein JWM28_1309 [Chitinophagaceae bacterium]|nr:hypothetical protein [Chitinophagaceae bacterium]